MDGKKRISGLKLAIKTSVVSGMTFLSRILGLVRDIVFARYFGASLVMDAFLVANRIPNMLRRFFAEGAFSQGFVPVMARYREKYSHEDAREFVDAMPGRIDEYETLLTDNRIWKQRTVGIGVLPPEMALEYGVTGPIPIPNSSSSATGIVTRSK